LDSSNAGVTTTSTSQSPAAPVSSFSFVNFDFAQKVEETKTAAAIAPAPASATGGFSFIFPATFESNGATEAPLPPAKSESQTMESSAPAFSSGVHLSIPSPSHDEVETKDAGLSSYVPLPGPANEGTSLANAASSAFSFLSSPPSSIDAASAVPAVR
jgi:hypothetical protein